MQFFPEEEGDILGHLIVASAFPGTKVLTNTVHMIADEYGFVNFRQLEQLMYYNQLPKAFIALDIDKVNRSGDYFAGDPVTRKKGNYQIAACPIGSRSSLLYVARLFDLNFDPYANFAQLENAGFLYVKPGSDTARRIAGAEERGN